MGSRGAARAAGGVDGGLAGGSDAVFLGAILAIATALRAWLPYRHVFVGGYVNFQTHDSWYHVRLIDALAQTFPWPLHVDPIAAPGGQAVVAGPLFDASIVVVARVIGLGHPSAAMLETIAAWAPVVYALATIVAVWAIGRRMFDPVTGLLAAALLATTPGPFLERTVLGYTDHHAAEACFSALALLGITAALQARRVSALAGVALGAYLITWTSGVFLLFILAVWAVMQYAFDYARGAGSDRVARAVVPAMLIAAAIVVVFEDRRVPQHDLRLVAALLTAGGVGALEAARRVLGHRARVRPAVVGAVAAMGLVLGVVGVRFAAPGVATTLLLNVRRLVPDAAAQTVGEALPLLSADAVASAFRAWFEFRSTFFLALPGLVLLAIDAWRRRADERALLVVWTIVVLAATLAQNRFGYYLSIELALIAAWMSATALRWAGVGGKRRSSALADFVVVVVAAAVFYPNVPPAIREVRFDFGVPPAWRDAFTWMRSSTEAPFADGDAAYARDARAGEAPAYVVMNWWDYGYWLMRIAHRVPIANPTQNGAADAARFFTETDPDAAARALDAARVRYVLTGEELPARAVRTGAVYESWFQAMPAWTDRHAARFYEAMFQRGASGALNRVVVFYPDYYQSMTSRLYLYGARAFEPRRSSWLVSFVDRAGVGGGAGYREITALRAFNTYADAARALEASGPGQHRIVGLDPMRSCVPLPDLDGFRVVYESPARSQAFSPLPAVRIVERRARTASTD